MVVGLWDTCHIAPTSRSSECWAQLTSFLSLSSSFPSSKCSLKSQLWWFGEKCPPEALYLNSCYSIGSTVQKDYRTDGGGALWRKYVTGCEPWWFTAFPTFCFLCTDRMWWANFLLLLWCFLCLLCLPLVSFETVSQHKPFPPLNCLRRVFCSNRKEAKTSAHGEVWNGAITFKVRLWISDNLTRKLPRMHTQGRLFSDSRPSQI